MTDTQKIAALEKQVASLNTTVASLKEQLNTMALQRASDTAVLSQRISVLESKR